MSREGMKQDAQEHAQLVCVIDDDEGVRVSLDSLLRSAGYETRTFASPKEFLASANKAACLLLDVRLRRQRQRLRVRQRKSLRPRPKR